MNGSAYIVTMKNGREFCTSVDARGVFERSKDGTWMQQRGLLQAPGGGRKFSSERSFITYLKKHFTE